MENNEKLNNQVNENNNIEKEKKTNNKIIGIVILVIGLLLVGFVGYKLFVEKPETDKSKENNAPPPTPAVVPTPSNTQEQENNQNENDGTSKKLSFYVENISGKNALAAEYNCKSSDCKMYEADEPYYFKNDYDGLIYDQGKYYILNFKDKSLKELAIPNGNYEHMTISYDKDNHPASIILENEENEYAIFSIKSNKIIIDYGATSIESPLLEESINRYLLLRYDDENNNSIYKIYSDKDEKIVLEKNQLFGCSGTLFSSNGKVYYISNYQHHTGGDISVEEVQSIDGKVIFKNNANYKFEGGSWDYDKMDYNYVVFDKKSDQVIIVDNHSGIFSIYDKNHNLINKSKKYDNILPLDDEFIGNSEYFSKEKNYYIVVIDNNKLNVIDYDENIISTLDSVDTDSRQMYIDGNDNNTSFNIYIEDKTLKAADFNENEVKKVDKELTLKKFLKDYNSGEIVLEYKYTYNITTKKIEKSKYFYYAD